MFINKIKNLKKYQKMKMNQIVHYLLSNMLPNEIVCLIYQQDHIITHHMLKKHKNNKNIKKKIPFHKISYKIFIKQKVSFKKQKLKKLSLQILNQKKKL